MAAELSARGYEPTYIRQPVPSTGTPGIIAFCKNKVIGTLQATDAEIMAIRNGLTKLTDKVDAEIEKAVKELE